MKPKRSAEQIAFINILKTADALTQALAATLRESGLSPAQYNVLRILRGAGKDGCSCGEIAGKMLTRDPDVTRLVDRLESRDLVSRSREGRDRRVITVRIADAGVQLLADLDGPIDALHRQQLGHLGRERLKALTELMEETRQHTA